MFVSVYGVLVDVCVVCVLVPVCVLCRSLCPRSVLVSVLVSRCLSSSFGVTDLSRCSCSCSVCV